MRFQDAARDARAVVYAGVQADRSVAVMAERLVDADLPGRILARAVMTGETLDPDGWRSMFPVLFGPDVTPATRDRAESTLEAALAIADRGDEVRNQLRGAIVEALTERLIARRVESQAIRRERRILFDGVTAEIHPYDVTVEAPGRAEAYDCKWGARGINADVLHQLDDARTHAADEDERLTVSLVVFDSVRSCAVRLDRQTAPHDRTRVIGLETLDELGADPA